MLIEGKWSADWQPIQAKTDKGAFVRQTSRFRHWITPDGAPGPAGDGGFMAEAGRYHLYVGLICPWASRTLMARALKGLIDVISVTVVDPVMTPFGWQFTDTPETGLDRLNGAHYMHEIYTRADPVYTGRATVPVLWDMQRQTIVNNESADILRILNAGFGRLATDAVDLYPEAHRADIDALNEHVYRRLNNGVYRAGFASTQEAYDEAYRDVFTELDDLKRYIAGKDYLFGGHVTEADIRLFVTLVRFDATYHGIFKCNKRRIADYPNLSAYLQRMLDLPGIRATVSIDHIKRGYYSLKTLNPSGIVPLGPHLPFA